MGLPHFYASLCVKRVYFFVHNSLFCSCFLRTPCYTHPGSSLRLRPTPSLWTCLLCSGSVCSHFSGEGNSGMPTQFSVNYCFFQADSQSTIPPWAVLWSNTVRKESSDWLWSQTSRVWTLAQLPTAEKPWATCLPTWALFPYLQDGMTTQKGGSVKRPGSKISLHRALWFSSLFLSL